ncbi:hypothetical protein CHARACLAT_026495 [Characodon lateralis]|uniref:Uncharacterized protein n=1 Tax=Characodon lateralis TaxID=208331 RepID=A0ABU7EMQ8_9TELE|nr:hypothetical protein [Characodon lateralis]
MLKEVYDGAFNSNSKMSCNRREEEEEAALAPKERTKKLRYKARLNYLPFRHYVTAGEDGNRLTILY